MHSIGSVNLNFGLVVGLDPTHNLRINSKTLG